MFVAVFVAVALSAVGNNGAPAVVVNPQAVAACIVTGGDVMLASIARGMALLSAGEELVSPKSMQLC